MSKLHFLSPILFLLCSFSVGEKETVFNEGWGGTVTYKVASTISEEEIEKRFNSLTDELKQHEEMMRDLMRQILDLEYELKFNATSNLFKQKELLAEKEEELTRKMALISISGNGIYFKDLKKKRKIKQEEYSGQLVNVKERFNSYDWKILDETKKIGEYDCRKAIAIVKDVTMSGEKEREVTAWFTEEIPVPFGPVGVDGLPGLILQVSLKGDYYLYVSEIKIGNDIITDKDITLPKGGNEISEEDWEEFQRKENERIRKKHQ